MKKIGFVGLGTMGFPMAANLLKAGYSLTVYNRTRSKAEELSEKGNVTIADSPADVARQSEVVITMVANDTALEEIILGENGIREGASQGLIVLDSSTVSPAIIKTVAKELASIGVDMLDAPVTGSEPQAMEGVLAFMVGGKKEIFDRCQPLFDAMGKQATHIGENGLGAYMKLANNTMAAINLISLSEALVLASKAGVDPEKFLEVVGGGGAKSGMAENKAPKMLNRDFHANFKTELMHKDLGLALDVAEELNIPVPALALVRQNLQMAMSSGYAEEDMCAVVKVYEEWAKTEVKKK